MSEVESPYDFIPILDKKIILRVGDALINHAPVFAPLGCPLTLRTKTGPYLKARDGEISEKPLDLIAPPAPVVNPNRRI